MKNFKSRVQQSALLMAAVFLVVSPLTIVFKINDGELDKALLWSALGLLLLSRFGDVLEFDALGIKAKLQQKLEEATASLDQVKKISAAIAKLALHDIANSDMMFQGKEAHYERLKSRREIKDGLRELGLSEKEISSADSSFFEAVSMFYALSILDRFKGNEALDDLAVNGEREDLKRQIKSLFEGKRNALPVKSLSDFFSRHYEPDDELQEKLDGYEYFLTHRELKNEEDYIERSTWSKNKVLDRRKVKE